MLATLLHACYAWTQFTHQRWIEGSLVQTVLSKLARCTRLCFILCFYIQSMILDFGLLDFKQGPGISELRCTPITLPQARHTARKTAPVLGEPGLCPLAGLDKLFASNSSLSHFFQAQAPSFFGAVAASASSSAAAAAKIRQQPQIHNASTPSPSLAPRRPNIPSIEC